jgi:hypothetical protein
MTLQYRAWISLARRIDRSPIALLLPCCENNMKPVEQEYVNLRMLFFVRHRAGKQMEKTKETPGVENYTPIAFVANAA